MSRGLGDVYKRQAQAFEWGVEPFLIWDFVKIVVMALITTKLWNYSSPEDPDNSENNIQ